jgi:hypothetical protein
MVKEKINILSYLILRTSNISRYVINSRVVSSRRDTSSSSVASNFAIPETSNAVFQKNDEISTFEGSNQVL